MRIEEMPNEIGITFAIKLTLTLRRRLQFDYPAKVKRAVKRVSGGTPLFPLITPVRFPDSIAR